MKLLAILLLLCGVALGQHTATTFTITDSDGTVWANGRCIVTFVPVPGNPGPYIFDGSPMTAGQKGPYQCSLDGTGTATINLPSNNFIVPTGTKWNFVLAPNASAPSSTVVSAVTGASQNLSATFSAAVTAPRFPALGTSSWGYTDGEVTPIPNPGGSYFNVTSKAVRVWDGSVWFSLSNSASTVTAVSATSPLQSSGGTTPDISFQNQSANRVLAGPTSGGAAAPNFRLLVGNDINGLMTGTPPIVVSGTAISCPTCSTGVGFPLLAPDGSAIAPSYSFTNNSNMGMYRAGANSLGFSVANSEWLGITSGLVRAFDGLQVDGTATVNNLTANNAISLNNDVNITGNIVSTKTNYLVQGKETSVAFGNPSAGNQRGYFKAGKGFCALDSSGVEYCTASTTVNIFRTATASGCTTGASSYDNCNDTLTWSSGGFADTSYFPVCSGLAPGEVGVGNDAPTLNVVSFTATQIVVITQTQRSQTAHFTQINCIGYHP